MTTYYPISFAPTQYLTSSSVLASGYVLKAYSAGTSTPISMATDYTGNTLVSTITLNASGYPTVSGNVVIPHISANYKLALYATQAAADANTGAIWNPDNIQVAQNANAARYLNFAVDTGAADSYVIAPDPAISAYAAGQTVTLDPSAANTGASTLAVSGLAAKNIKLPSGAALYANAMLSTGQYLLIYDGTNWVLVNPNIPAFTGDTGSGGLTGLVPAPAAGDAGKILYGDGTFVSAALSMCGRITLTTALPVLVADVTAATTVYYTPYRGNVIALYTGSIWKHYTFTEMSQLTTDATKSPAACANSSNYDLFVWLDSTTMRCTRGPAWTSDTGRGTGAGTSELVMTNGIYLNNVAITNGPAASRGTYVGTIRTNASAQVDVKFGQTPAAGGSAAVLGLWNMYNRVPVTALTLESADSWTYTSATLRQLNNSASNKVSFIRGQNEEPVRADVSITAEGDTNGDNIAIAIGLDSATTASGRPNTSPAIVGARMQIVTARYDAVPGLGFHYLAPLEGGATTITFYGDNAAPTLTQAGMAVHMSW